MGFAIRQYHPSDLPAMYRICLLTGNSGSDASQLYRDHELLGHFYAAPYAVREPDLCFVLTNSGEPCGYILGTRASAAFAGWCEQSWFPVLRARYPLPAADDRSADANLIRLIHRGHQAAEDLLAYPAHLHIDLLPQAQGQGWGRRLVQAFVDRLRALHVPGLHLGVGKKNTGAVAFYQRVGFHLVKEDPGSIIFGMRIG